MCAEGSLGASNEGEVDVMDECVDEARGSLEPISPLAVTAYLCKVDLESHVFL